MIPKEEMLFVVILLLLNTLCFAQDTLDSSSVSNDASAKGRITFDTIDTIATSFPSKSGTEIISPLGILKGIAENLRGHIGYEGFYYFNEYKEAKKNDHSHSLIFNGAYKYSSKNSGIKFAINPFLRVDFVDRSRTHFDFRYFYFSFRKKAFETSIGIQNISWGFSQAFSIVNIINQTDEKEGILKGERLGQPMVQFSYSPKLGSFHLYVIPFFRKKNFPDIKSRFYYFPLPLENKKGSVNSDIPDLAFRYYKTKGKLDFAASYFNGINRNPQIIPNFQTFQLSLEYKRMQQAGIELQYVYKDLLPKLEGIYRYESGKSYFGITAGLEYTFANFLRKNLDINIVGEYLYDEWRINNFYPFGNNFTTGIRASFNDIHSTSCSIKGITETKSLISIINLELSRKIADGWIMKGSVSQYFGKTLEKQNPLYVLQYNNNFNLIINKYF